MAQPGALHFGRDSFCHFPGVWGANSGLHFQGEVWPELVWNQQITGYQQDQCVNKAIIHAKYKTREFVANIRNGSLPQSIVFLV